MGWFCSLSALREELLWVKLHLLQHVLSPVEPAGAVGTALELCGVGVCHPLHRA